MKTARPKRAATTSPESLLRLATAHDLLNLFGPIESLVDLLQEEVAGGPPETRELVEMLADHCIHLREQMVALGHALRLREGDYHGQPRLVELAGEVAATTEPLAASLRLRQLSLEIDVPAGLQTEVDPALLRVVLRNLLANAIRFSPPHGRLELTGGTGEGGLWLRVRDYGPGLSPEMLGRLNLGEAPATAAESAGGGRFGLGLRLCLAVAQALGLRLEFSGAPGHGLEVRLVLPEARSAAPRGDAPTA